MSDEFLERLGEIAVAAAWLEDLLSDFIHALCGTKRAVVLTERMTFDTKCNTVVKMAEFSDNRIYVRDVASWIKECRAVARERNDLIHTRHRSQLDGTWRRVEQTADTEISIEKLAAIPVRIAELCDRGKGYIDHTKEHRDIDVGAALIDTLAEKPTGPGK
jgi:hypothetical protein